MEAWWARLSISRAVFWIVLIGPSVLFGWVYSVAFVAACSIYANAASDFAAWRADKNTDIIQRLDRIEDQLAKLLEEVQIDN